MSINMNFETMASVPLTAREAASGLLGSVSLACWVFLLVPQLIENYKYGSADALSLGFLIVWFVGDLANLIGSLWARLVPVIIAIAVYYCLADGVLISQVIYYNVKNARKDAHMLRISANGDGGPNGAGGGAGGAHHDDDGPDHTTPLLSRGISEASYSSSSPALRRISSRRSTRHHRREVQDSLAKLMEEMEPKNVWVKNALSLISICALGAIGWVIAWQTGVWRPTPAEGPDSAGDTAMGAMIVGYFSAVCYLGARIPQILKNHRDKSCEGLSLLFFLLSLLGNLTYGAGILFHSTEKEYVITNIPWLIGSLGTMVEDITIFVQFYLYAVNEGHVAVV